MTNQLSTLCLKCLFFTGCIVLTQFQAHATALPCQAAQIKSFYINQTDHYPSDERDYCDLPTHQIPVEIRQMLEKIGETHEKSALFFQKTSTAAELFPEGITIVVSGSEQGSMAYASDPIANQIEITVFPDWKGPDFDSISYTHELGHIIASQTVKTLSIIESLDYLSVFSEGFADFLAMALNDGHIQKQDPSLSKCVNQAGDRDLNLLASFNDPAYQFSPKLLYDQLMSCCKRDPETQSSPNLQRLCKSIAIDIEKAGFQEAGDRPFDPKSCINSDTGKKNQLLCDSHKLGMPVNSMLLALNRKLHNSTRKSDKNIFELFLQSLALASSDPRDTFSCAYNNPEGLKHPLFLEASSYKPVFKHLKALLGPAMETEFGLLWNLHAIDKGMELSSLEETQVLLPERAFFKIKERTDKNPDGFYNTRNPCYKKYPDADTYSGDSKCRIICVDDPAH